MDLNTRYMLAYKFGIFLLHFFGTKYIFTFYKLRYTYSEFRFILAIYLYIFFHICKMKKSFNDMSNTIIILNLSAMTNACLLQKQNAMTNDGVSSLHVHIYIYEGLHRHWMCCSKARVVSMGKEMTANNCHGNVFT